MAKVELIKVPVNNHFVDSCPIENDFSNEKSAQLQLKKLNSGSTPRLYLNASKTSAFDHINILSFRSAFDNDEKLIYDVLKSGDNYFVKTGLYVGYLFVDGIKLEINPGYNDVLLRRMLNVANNIFFDNSSNHSGKESGVDSFLSLILEYLFLSSFKNAFALGLPLIYRNTEESSLNIKGRINLKKYISKDIVSSGQISYNYNDKTFDQDIIDVLYLAFNSVGKEKVNKIIKNGERYHKELKSLYSGCLISRNKLRTIVKKKSLNNPMYSKYKIVLKYAKYILEHKNIALDDENSSTGIAGFLLDISELWEVYIANLLKSKFVDYDVKSQTKLDLYDGTFFARSNFPDIIMESSDKIIVIDAKFKTMNFRNQDVDREDLHQINSYSGYYRIAKKDKKCLSCLVYPSELDCEKSNNKCTLYGLSNTESKFSIEYVKIGNTFESLVKNEESFLKRIDDLVNS